MYPSRITGYQDPISWTFSKVLLAPICELVIFFKLLMYVFSHRFLLSSYKAFFLWESSCYKSCLVSHDVSIYCMMELRTSLHVSILHPRHHSSWMGLPFLLGYFFIIGRLCINDVIAFVILFFILNYHHLFFGTSLILLFLYNIVHDISQKSNAPFVWLDTFNKAYS